MNGSREALNKQPVSGLLLVDKPAGCTSHDVVAVVRRAARSKRVGHAGTLDPFATGLLVIAIGSCTRLLPYLASEPKVYDATIRFGTETNTDDSTGEVVRSAALPDMAGVVAATGRLTGALAQIPPAFSAKHVNGQRAYVMARRGDVVELLPTDIVVHSWSVTNVLSDRIDARITCGGGTYIRALARDLGRLMHCAAHCSVLHRVSSGTAHVHDAVAYEALSPGAIADGAVTVQSPLPFLETMAHVPLDADSLAAVMHGRSIAASASANGSRAALLYQDQVVGIAERRDDAWLPRVVLPGEVT